MTTLPPIEPNLVAELRQKLLKAMEDNGWDKYHPADIQRVKEKDFDIWAFLVHHRRDVIAAFDAAMECMKWRFEFGTNDIKQSEFPQFFDDIGALYTMNKDKQGHRILVMHVRRYKKEPIVAALVKRYFVHHLESMYREDSIHRITILFDMHGAGLHNVDMDFLYFMFLCYKTYYPSAISNVLAYDMPWIFTAIWKIVKGWLNARAVAKIKFVNKNTILEYVSPDQLLEEFGGTVSQSRKFPYDHLLVK